MLTIIIALAAGAITGAAIFVAGLCVGYGIANAKPQDEQDN